MEQDDLRKDDLGINCPISDKRVSIGLLVIEMSK
jgi:hypothetical protein